MTVLLFFFFSLINSLSLNEKIISSDSYQILTRFCFSSNNNDESGIDYSAQVPAVSSHHLFLYPTTFDWKLITDSASTCLQNYNSADFKFNITKSSGFFPIHISKSQCYFVAIANCVLDECSDGMCQGNLNIDYTFSLQNGKVGSGFSGHLSCDEEGMLVVVGMFFAIQILLLVCIYVIQFALLKIDKYHITVRMLKWSIFITLISDIFYLIYYVYYNNDGHKWKLLHTIGALFQQISETLLVLLLILLAKGWTIAVRKISRQGRMKISIYFSLYLWISLAAILWKDYGLTELESKYLVDNPPGIVLVVVRCLLLVWFCYSMYTTCKNVHKKVHFYQKFFICSAIWLIALILINSLVDTFSEASRYTLYFSLSFSITFILQLVFCLLYFPNVKWNQSFPFQMKTSDWSDKKDQEKRLSSPNPSDPDQMSDWFSAQTTYIREISLQLTKIFDSSFKEVYPATVQYLQGGKRRYNAELDDEEIKDVPDIERNEADDERSEDDRH